MLPHAASNNNKDRPRMVEFRQEDLLAWTAKARKHQLVAGDGTWV